MGRLFVRLPPPVKSRPFVLRMVLLAGSKATRNSSIITNYPVDESVFNRTSWHRMPFQGDNLADFYCDIQIKMAGIFEFKVEYQDWESHETLVSNDTFSVLVDPRLTIPQAHMLDSRDNQQQELVPLDAITILTVIPKWMPTLNHWMPYFHSFSETGYNMVHFAPMNTRGISNSPYSIYDQLSFSDDLFDVKLTQEQKQVEIKTMIDQIRDGCGILSVTDVVWNHTACNSVWLEEHPDSGYNLKNSPHLRPAYELDEMILEFSQSLLPVYGKNPCISTEQDLKEVMTLFKHFSIPSLKLWEFYVIDVKESVLEFTKNWNFIACSISPNHPYKNVNLGSMTLPQRAALLSKDALLIINEGSRFGKKINISIALLFVQKYLHDVQSPCNSQVGSKEYEHLVNEINLVFYKEYDADLEHILNQIETRAMYLRVSDHGPKLGPVSRNDPLVDTYFTRLPDNQRTRSFTKDELVLACNGWIWNADPLINFASRESKAYLRRDVIAWGDCVKLRYGDKYQDNPWLWEHQTQYTRLMASMFHGFRIDNCHSTPMHVASYLLDVGRAINPNLYVFAELFTGSEEKDMLFVSKLGINSLIRESMNAWDPHELSRIIHRQGGDALGSFTLDPNSFPYEMLVKEDSTCPDYYVELRGSNPHSLLMDCTHDNETPHQRRTAEDTLPNAAITAMANCAVGSVKGYDEIVPELLNIVTETRKYRVPESFEGIIPAKSLFYNLHSKMAKRGFSEIYVHQERDFISIHRMHPLTHEGYLLIARTAYRGDHPYQDHSPIILKNQRVQVIESATLKVQTHGQLGQSCMPYPREYHVEEDDEELLTPQSPTLFYHRIEQYPQEQVQVKFIVGCITGLPCMLTFSTSLTNLCQVKEEPLGDSGQDIQTVITTVIEHFSPGSIVLYKTWNLGSGMEPLESVSSLGGSIDKLDGFRISTSQLFNTVGFLQSLEDRLNISNPLNSLKTMCRLGSHPLRLHSPWFINNSESDWPKDLYDCIKSLGMEEINCILYRCGREELDTIGLDLYDIPSYGKVAYGGLEGFVTILAQVSLRNDLGHPLCANLRQGPWMMDYIVSRLERYSQIYPKLIHLAKWLDHVFSLAKRLVSTLIPKYFALIVMNAYQAVRNQAFSISNLVCKSEFSSSLQLFQQACAMTTFQMYGMVKSTGLYSLERPMNIRGISIAKGNVNPSSHQEQPLVVYPCPSLAAGLPHFSTCHMRCWGRDVFISLRGLFLVHGHFEAARAHIIAFGSTLKHGLIPNLLDQSVKPRYNARDAAWWWLHAVSEYCKMSPEGYEFLGTMVERRFVPLKRYTHGSDYGRNYPPSQENSLADEYIPNYHPLVYSYSNTIAELCYEILERHGRGISFREWNAGPELDHAMTSKGFDISIGVNWDNGFVYGGNAFNCGTWMDKMGDSEKSGNKGVPATPRDGSPIEIIGLLKSFLNWIVDDVLDKHKSPYWKWNDVERADEGSRITFGEWRDLIQSRFNLYFYIPLDASLDSQYHVDSKLINKRGIYKDTYGSCTPFADYQLRPNQCVTMCVAPELFVFQEKEDALDIIQAALAGPLGIKTLDPTDWAYRGNYDNSNDSNDPSISHGFNYHQGPEWLWVFGTFLVAFHSHYKVKKDLQYQTALYKLQKWLLNHKLYIQQDAYAGLPELTNQDGEKCSGSCPTQAWSSSILLELIEDFIG